MNSKDTLSKRIQKKLDKIDIRILKDKLRIHKDYIKNNGEQK